MPTAGLLQGEARLRTALRRAIDDAVAAHEPVNPKTASELLTAAHLAGKDAEMLVKRALRDGNEHALRMAGEHLERALRKDGMGRPVKTGAVVLYLLGKGGDDRVQTARNELLAARTGNALTDAVGAAIGRAGAPLKGALGRAGQALRTRIDTIAATENARAYNKARQTAADAAAQGSGPYRTPGRVSDNENDPRNAPVEETVTVLEKTWNAVLDRRTCSLCASLSGTTVGVREPFPGGYEPGGVHPRCRCYADVSARTVTTRKGRAA